jgi:hypothetical protein
VKTVQRRTFVAVGESRMYNGPMQRAGSGRTFCPGSHRDKRLTRLPPSATKVCP